MPGLSVCNIAFLYAARHKTTRQGRHHDIGQTVPIYNVIGFVICRQTHNQLLTYNDQMLAHYLVATADCLLQILASGKCLTFRAILRELWVGPWLSKRVDKVVLYCLRRLVAAAARSMHRVEASISTWNTSLCMVASFLY